MSSARFTKTLVCVSSRSCADLIVLTGFVGLAGDGTVKIRSSKYFSAWHRSLNPKVLVEPFGR